MKTACREDLSSQLLHSKKERLKEALSEKRFYMFVQGIVGAPFTMLLRTKEKEGLWILRVNGMPFGKL